MASKAQMKQEAVRRMYKHLLTPVVIEMFETKGIVVCSDHGKIRELTAEERIMVAQYEKNSYNLVYHVIHSFGQFETYELCNVSYYSEDWGYENDVIDRGWLIARSINITVPGNTESGSILIANNNGVLERLY